MQRLPGCFSKFELPFSFVTDSVHNFQLIKFRNYSIGMVSNTSFKKLSNGQDERYMMLNIIAFKYANLWNRNTTKLNIFLLQYRKAQNIIHRCYFFFKERYPNENYFLIIPTKTYFKIKTEIIFEFRDRFFYIGDSVAVRCYNSVYEKLKLNQRKTFSHNDVDICKSKAVKLADLSIEAMWNRNEFFSFW